MRYALTVIVEGPEGKADSIAYCADKYEESYLPEGCYCVISDAKKSTVEKETIMSLLDAEYDKWTETEETNEQKGIGKRGANGSLSSYSTEDIFNELIVRYNIKLKN